MHARIASNSRARSRARRALRLGVSMVLASVGLSALVVGATALSAGASPTTVSKPTTVSGGQTLFAATVLATGTGVSAGFSFNETIKWTQPADLNTTFDPNTVRQGQSPSPTVSYSASGAGTMTVTWSVKTIFVAWTGVARITIGSASLSASGPCTLKASGGSYTCHLKSGQSTIFDAYPVPLGPYVKFALGATVTVSPEALTTLRRAVFDGTTEGTRSIQVTENPVTDSLTIPCTVAAGTSLTYALTALSATDAVKVANKVFFTVGLETPTPPFFTEADIPFASPTISLGTLDGTIEMSGPGATFSFGSVQPNNVPPLAKAGGPYSGAEGSPVGLTGLASSSICGFPTLVWNFSDGGVAYGPSPEHTFEGPGTYSGLLTATDATGLTATTTFTVSVADLPPVAHAGPPMTTQWGVPVTLTGDAVDPGTSQQPLLTYGWTFGDGTGGAGGTSVAHVYASPGTYVATFTACDPELVCGQSTTLVTVTQRMTTLSYTGATAGSVTDAATFKASLVDDTGAPVVGANVEFYADGSPVPFAGASTNTFGIASVQYGFGLGSVGAHTVVAKFTGTTKDIGAASSPTTFTVSKDGTGLAYAGVTSVKPSHAAAFSATLTDDAGRPLQGKTVTFTLGSQSCNATTSASGLASCSISKVTAKSGKYVLDVAFGGTANYVASSDGVGFEVG